MELNKIYCADCFDLMQEIPDEMFDLIIIDPPYFRIKGEFDYTMSFEHWQQMHERLAIECRRILKPNGSLFLYGHARNIAYQQVIFDKYFNLLNSLVWEKQDCQTKKQSPDTQRRFVPITERILFYDNGEDKSGLQMIFSNKDLFLPIKTYMREQKRLLMEEKGFKNAEFNKYIDSVCECSSVASRHFFADSQYMFPTEAMYKRLQSTGFWRREYEDLRREYEDLRRVFDNDSLITDVLRYAQEVHITKNYNHPTKKPPKLTMDLIRITTKENANVFIPFGGSGTEIAACIRLKRNYLSSEINPEYVEIINNRILEAEKSKNNLFNE